MANFRPTPLGFGSDIDVMVEVCQFPTMPMKVENTGQAELALATVRLLTPDAEMRTAEHDRTSNQSHGQFLFNSRFHTTLAVLSSWPRNPAFMGGPILVDESVEQLVRIRSIDSCQALTK